MNSKVVETKNGKIKLVFVEPGNGKYRSQISEFLEYNHGAGVQHVAFLAENIVETVRTLNLAGVEFLSIPESYYDIQKNKLGCSEVDLNIFKKHSILLDRDEAGYIYQAFTKPIAGRPTLFFEIIQRKDCNGFGSGNIKALFQAVEQEQLKRETADFI